MRHIEILHYGEPPCGGEVRRVPRVAPRRSLPIAGVPQPADEEWVCERCGHRWEREPRPEEAL